MLDALRVLWAALVGLYDEALVLIRGNLLWLVLTIPLYLVTAALLVPLAAMGSGAEQVSAPAWPFLLAALLTIVLPSPGAFGVGALAEVIAQRDSPRFEICSAAARRYWRRGLVLFSLGVVVFALLAVNLLFYASIGPEALRFLAVAWLYGLLFWLALQAYLVPLLLRRPDTGILDLYRRAALLTLGHPLFSGTLALALLLVAGLSIVALPVYFLLAGAFVALARAQAFRRLRVHHGDLPNAGPEGAP